MQKWILSNNKSIYIENVYKYKCALFATIIQICLYEYIYIYV